MHRCLRARQSAQRRRYQSLRPFDRARRRMIRLTSHSLPGKQFHPDRFAASVAELEDCLPARHESPEDPKAESFHAIRVADQPAQQLTDALGHS